MINKMEKENGDFLITQYKYLAEEIRFSKRLQFMGTVNAILLYGGIIKFYPGSKLWLFIIVLIFLLLAGVFFICSCKRSQSNNNNRLKKLRCNHFTILCKMENALETNNEIIKNFSWIIPCFFCLCHIMAFVITLVILLDKECVL